MIEKLGRGHQAKVRKVKKISSGQIYALKIFDDRATAEREIEVLKTLNSVGCHPLISCYYGAIELNNSIGVLTEYAEGYVLADIRKYEGKIEDVQMVQIMVYVFKGLVYIHSKGIVHNDISASNIVFGDHGLKIIDYGLACFYRDGGIYKCDPEKTTDHLFELETDEVMYNPDLYPKIDVINAGIMFWRLITQNVGSTRRNFIGMTDHYKKFVTSLSEASNRPSYYALHSPKLLLELQTQIDKYPMDTESDIVETVLRMTTRVDPYFRPSALEIVDYLASSK